MAMCKTNGILFLWFGLNKYMEINSSTKVSSTSFMSISGSSL